MRMKVLMKKKVFKITLILVLCGVGAFWLISAFKSDSTPVLENQVVTVQRGDLTIDITASGNLALSVTEDLAFEMAGTVEEILVEEGESVKEGQVLAKLDTSEWDTELTNLERDELQAEINLKNAERALEQAEEGTSTAITGDITARTTTTDPDQIRIYELQVKLAEGRLEDAQKALQEAQDASPEITAPFDGFITAVNVSGGDEVKKGTVGVTIADPSKFEADILVSEMDIPKVKLGGDAGVEVDAMEGLSLPAKVTHISPTATIQSGVVNYKVKVEVQPLETVVQGQQQAGQQATQQTPQGQEGQQRRTSATIPQNFQLRQGLTVTVSIIVQEKNDVLLVPNGAIITQGRQSHVQVMSPDGTIEERTITTGISNWQYTEITDGLSEGEKVIVPQATTSTSTTQQGPPGGMFIPGMGR